MALPREPWLTHQPQVPVRDPGSANKVGGSWGTIPKLTFSFHNKGHMCTCTHTYMHTYKNMLIHIFCIPMNTCTYPHTHKYTYTQAQKVEETELWIIIKNTIDTVNWRAVGPMWPVTVIFQRNWGQIIPNMGLFIELTHLGNTQETVCQELGVPSAWELNKCKPLTHDTSLCTHYWNPATGVNLSSGFCSEFNTQAQAIRGCVSLTLAGRNIAVLPVDAVLMLRHIAPGAHVSIWISVGNKDTLMILLCFKPPGPFSFTELFPVASNNCCAFQCHFSSGRKT